MSAARDDPIGLFVDACIEDASKARSLAAADRTLVHARWRGDPLLHWMVIEDFAAGVATLLGLGVPADCRDDHGTTTLHVAARCGRLGIARLLLQRGADVNAVDVRMGENALALALSGRHVDVAVLLLEHGARGDYLLPGVGTVFRAMAGLEPGARHMLVELLAARGITRDGLFRTLHLDRDYGYESPQQAFGW